MRGLPAVVLIALFTVALPASAAPDEPLAEQAYLYLSPTEAHTGLVVCSAPSLHLHGACFEGEVFASVGTYRFEVVDDSGRPIGFRVQPFVHGPIQPFQPYDGCGTFTHGMDYVDLDDVIVYLHPASEACPGTPTTGTVQVYLE